MMKSTTNKTNLYPILIVTLIALPSIKQVNAATVGYAPWLTQIGINDTVMSAANWGRGWTLGIVDTGIVANNAMFASGQVSSTLSSCAAVSFKCSNGVFDDNGHGTAVASMAAANAGAPFSFTTGGTNPYVVTKGMAVGVAQNANIIAEKVLSAAGSGYSTDVANGIIKAADAGASVINLSLTYGNTADLVKAVNYAASKGAYVVWAGGNSGVNLLNGSTSTGLTADAVNRLVLVGSVNSKNVVSSFSNKPGTGAIIATDKTVKSYASRWVMAPGENIFGPNVVSGGYGLWSGTSMSTPLVSGSLILLESTWPILKTKGSAANLLIATSTDLGTRGVDATYGNGLVNVAKAFQPYGSLSIAQANGSSIPVTSLSGKLITSGALGTLSSVQSKLSNYTVFDTYSRNFTMNLSGLIAARPTAASLNPLPTNSNKGPVVMKLNGGGEFTTLSYSAPMDTELLGLNDRQKSNLYENRSMYAMLNTANGNTYAIGYAYPSGFSYARAMYGNEDLARMANSLGLMSLSTLADGGQFMAYGTQLDANHRLAFSWNQSPRTDLNSQLSYTASNINMGLSHQVNNQLLLGFNLSMLNEHSGLLGTSYTGETLSFGNSNASNSIGFSAAYHLDAKNALLFETAITQTQAQTGAGIISNTSDIQAQSLGITYQSKDWLNKNDAFSFSIKQPLRVNNGYTNVLNTTVDAAGLPVYSYDRVSLVPNGRELDFSANYSLYRANNQTINLNASYRSQVANVEGVNETSAMMTWDMKF